MRLVQVDSDTNKDSRFSGHACTKKLSAYEQDGYRVNIPGESAHTLLTSVTVPLVEVPALP